MEEGHHDCRHQPKVTFPTGDVKTPFNDSNFYKIDPSTPADECDAHSEGGASTSTDVSGFAALEIRADPFADFAVDVELSSELGKEILDAHEFGTLSKLVSSRIANGLENGSFLVMNLSSVLSQFQQWKRELPMVEPFYAVKCNPDPVVLRLLAALGCNFDCATMGEIDLVLNGMGDKLSFGPRGLAHSSIVYANPSKMEHMLQFAASNDVRMTVFDGEDELHKIAAVQATAGLPMDHMKLLLRLTTDDKASICRFSKKFGCPVAEAPHLLQVAHSLGLCVSGVSFHVGSGCGDAGAYTTALEHAFEVFAAGDRLGMAPMTIVDLGGGFPGAVDSELYGHAGTMPTFQCLAARIREGLSAFAAKVQALGDNRPLRFIAEPGRYFVSASTVVATKVYGRKGGRNQYQALFVDDGVYGTFNNVVYDHATPVPQRLDLSVALGKGDAIGSGVTAAVDGAAVELIPTAVFGPTCDGLDQMCSLESTVLPRTEVGDWLLWDNMGAYTHTASFVFNGYTHLPQKLHCVL